MSVTITDEEYKYLQRCRRIAEFFSKNSSSISTCLSSHSYLSDDVCFEFELRGFVNLHSMGPVEGDPLDLPWLQQLSSAKPKLIEGE